MPKAGTLAWASLATVLMAPPALAATDALPQPISAATTVLKALFSVFGTQASVINNDLIKLDGSKRVFFGRVPGSDCKFVEMRPDDGFAGQIDFSQISTEYDTSPSCAGGTCGIALTLIGQGPAVCWTSAASYPLTGNSADFSKGKCFSRVTFPSMDTEAARLVLRSVRVIQRTSCKPIVLKLE